MGKRYPKSEFIGIDINPDLILSGNEFFQEQEVENCYLETGNIFNLKEDYIQEFDGIVSFQTLSWLPEFEEPLEAMTSLQAEWLALTSLFYDGPISCTIDVQDHEATSQPHHYNNIYSLPLVKDFLSDKGYSSFQFGPFEIDIDLPKPNTKGMGTYTKKLNKGRRLQISGPLLMPWYFVGAKQQKS